LKGKEIPLAARIISVVDAFDAMTSSRPYREAFPKEYAYHELERCVNRQFDEKIVDVFLKKR